MSRASYHGFVPFTTTTVNSLGAVPSVEAGAGTLLALRWMENMMPCFHEHGRNREMLSRAQRFAVVNLYESQARRKRTRQATEDVQGNLGAAIA